MLAHITYLSDEGMQQKFGRRLEAGTSGALAMASAWNSPWKATWPIRAAGSSSASTPTATCTSRAPWTTTMRPCGVTAILTQACRRIQSRVLVVSFDSDWLCPPDSGRDLALALIESGKKVTYANLSARFGHDSFLLEPESVTAIVSGLLSN
jgi:homoserine O-acetyltransferase